VTVIDNINPTITCYDPVDTGTNSGCQAIVTHTPPTYDDNCAVTMARVSGPASGSLFPVGRSITTYRATDASGNWAQCVTNTDVFDDDPPVVDCKPSITVTINAQNNFRVTIVESTVVNSKSDNCAIFSTALSPNVIDFNTVSPTSTTVTVVDRYGLRSTCTTEINVVRGKVIDLGTYTKLAYEDFLITWYNYGIFAATSKVTIRIYDTAVYNAADPIVVSVASNINYISPQGLRNFNYSGIAQKPCNTVYYVRLFIKDGTNLPVYVGQEPFYFKC